MNIFLICLVVWCVIVGLAVIFMGMPAAADHDAPESRIPEPATPETLEFFANYEASDLSLIGYLDDDSPHPRHVAN